MGVVAMLKKFNLVVSTYRRRENDCISELWYLLRELGDESIDASTTGLPGLIVARTSLDPLEVVEKLRELAEDKPWYFRFILKVVPVQRVVPADLNSIAKAAEELASSIAEDETFRVTVRSRLSDLGKREIIEAVASRIDRKVNLENPDKIVLVEVIGDVAGVSVIKPEHVLSLQKIRRERRLRQGE